ncbi:conserved exported hypothetical protein [uncultured Eubacteriales bacterium]|uniref:DUF192 domain-containing protein n=1 Tax=uncultured Eubacteriales bacterium TaxID=172733 RepID=A0A212JE09_9FIRM|nr:conserved exported hypothetical protein [uncultured Eubacteriales bacterium]
MRSVLITPPAGPPFSASLADTFLPRFLGLMGKNLVQRDALLLSPCNQIHCFFMKSAIDAVYLAPSGEILALTASMAPGTVGKAVKGAARVLELYPGDAQRLGLAPGQILAIGGTL